MGGGFVAGAESADATGAGLAPPGADGRSTERSLASPWAEAQRLGSPRRCTLPITAERLGPTFAQVMVIEISLQLRPSAHRSRSCATRASVQSNRLIAPPPPRRASAASRGGPDR